MPGTVAAGDEQCDRAARRDDAQNRTRTDHECHRIGYVDRVPGGEREDAAMSDERAEGPRPDETRRFPPFDDESDATRIQGGADWDQPGDATRSGDDMRPPDPTSIMPPVDEAGAAAWAGRAEVR